MQAVMAFSSKAAGFAKAAFAKGDRPLARAAVPAARRSAE